MNNLSNANKHAKALIGIAVLMIAFAVVYFSAFSQLHPEGEILQGEAEMLSQSNRRITASEARAMMRRNPNAIILDVRTEQEFATGRIPGAILLPDYAIEYRAAQVLPNYDALILVYCRSGNRSRTAVNLLSSMGYTNVYDFGGINTWPYDTE